MKAENEEDSVKLPEIVARADSKANAVAVVKEENTKDPPSL